jgi:DNA-binding protein H-NS
MNSKLLALEAKKRLQVESERDNKHEKATDWVEERKRLSKRAKEETEKERTTNSSLKISNWQE